MYRKAAANKYDMVVVPGIHFENEAWGRIMKGRIYWAKHLYDRGIAKNIMFSGSSVYSPYYEGEVMAMYAEAIGIPKEHIFTETKAEHSTENIYYSYKKSKKLGFETIALASDPFQTRMLRGFTKRKVSRGVQLIPFVIDTMKLIEASMVDPNIDFAKAYNPAFLS
ncbi:MAG: YdcF family protein, partial [Chitinophagaceae bacterium]